MLSLLERMSSFLFEATSLPELRMSSLLPPAFPPRISAPGDLAALSELSMEEDGSLGVSVGFATGVKSRVGSPCSCRDSSSCRPGNQSRLPADDNVVRHAAGQCGHLNRDQFGSLMHRP